MIRQSDRQVQEAKPYKEFSNVRPDISGKRKDGSYGIVERNWYTLLIGGDRQVFYSPLVNDYYVAEDKKCDKDQLEKDLLPRLSWAFDQWEIEEIKVKAKDDKGKEKQVGTGKFKVVNHFPPSPANIAKKREEITNQALATGEQFTRDDIYNKTLPVSILSDQDIDRIALSLG